jgi:glyoxylate reductase
VEIAILNDSCFEDTHLERLRLIGRLTVHDETTSEQQACVRLKDVDMALVDGFKFPITKAVIESSTRLQLIVLNSTAFHMVDLAAANHRGVKVANAPDYSTEAVAEHAIALMLAVVRSIPLSDAAMRNSPFQIDPSNREHKQFLGFELRGKTLGVVGLGTIGTRVAELGLALGMKVIAHSRAQKRMDNVEFVVLDDLLRRSDIVSINLALNPQTENIIAGRELGLMKPDSVLINTADGRLVNTLALYQALKERQIAAAGLDVLAEWDSHNLLSLNNVVLTPQSASWTREASVNLAECVVKTVEAFARGKPINLVN